MTIQASPPTAAIILAAGKGTRMKSTLPKVMHEIAQLPMLGHVLKSAKNAGLSPIVVVIAPEMDNVANFARNHGALIAVQAQQLGTGHAVLCAKEALQHFSGDFMVLYGDTPLITPDTLQDLKNTLHTDQHTTLAVLGFEPDEPGAYGRLIMNDDDTLERIVEARDASEEEATTTLCNSGVMALRGSVAWDVLGSIRNSNSKGEYYLTDAVAIMNNQGMRARVVHADADEVMGVNSRIELAQAEAVFQYRMRTQMMEQGVTLRDPDTVYFAHDTQIAPDCIIEQHVVFGTGVSLDAHSIVKAFSYVEGSAIGEHAHIGPFARLRPGNQFADHVKIGNFVEVKKSTLAHGAKVNHLSYIGDTSVGENANIGAGTITCNYDGLQKYQTIIGAGAFIGSNSALVAPVVIGSGAIVAAGSVITSDVSPDALALGRAQQSEKLGWAAEFKKKRSS